LSFSFYLHSQSTRQPLAARFAQTSSHFQEIRVIFQGHVVYEIQSPPRGKPTSGITRHTVAPPAGRSRRTTANVLLIWPRRLTRRGVHLSHHSHPRSIDYFRQRILPRPWLTGKTGRTRGRPLRGGTRVKGGKKFRGNPPRFPFPGDAQNQFFGEPAGYIPNGGPKTPRDQILGGTIGNQGPLGRGGNT